MLFAAFIWYTPNQTFDYLLNLISLAMNTKIIFFFVLACNSCNFSSSLFSSSWYSSKFEFFIYTKKTYRHLPNILLFQWCFGWNVLLLWKTSKKFFFYNKIIMNMLGLIIGLFLLYYYGIFFFIWQYISWCDMAFSVWFFSFLNTIFFIPTTYINCHY